MTISRALIPVRASEASRSLAGKRWYASLYQRLVQEAGWVVRGSCARAGTPTTHTDA